MADLDLMELNKIKNKENQMENKIKLASTKTVDGVDVYFDGTLAEKTAIFSDEAMTVPMADGDYEMENGDKVSVSGGLVEKIEVKEGMADVVPADAPVDAKPEAGNAPLTSDEVSKMIDARFAEVMDELTNIKTAIEPLIAGNADVAEMGNKLKSIEEKLSSTSASLSITKKPKTSLDVDGDKFSKDLERIRHFSKV